MERYVIERLSKVKAAVISYKLWMSINMEEIFSVTAHYCTGIDRKKNHIGMPSTTATDVVSMYLSVVEVVDKFSLGLKVLGITSDGGGNLRFLGRYWSQNTPMTPFFTTQAPINHGVHCIYIGRGLQRGSAINKFG